MNKSYHLSCTWLKKRAEMYSNIAKSGLSTLDKVEFHFSDPHDCWVWVTISIDGKEVAKARLSNVLWGDPVRNMIDWAESCTNNTSNYCFPFGEGTDYVFHYEDLLFNQREENGKWLGTGIFSLYINRMGDIQFVYALCDTKEFLESFYNAILDFAKRQEANENVVEEWAWEIYGDGREEYSEEEKELTRKKMLDNLKSPVIEEYIRKKHK
jgi:hypothetical protein